MFRQPNRFQFILSRTVHKTSDNFKMAMTLHQHFQNYYKSILIAFTNIFSYSTIFLHAHINFLISTPCAHIHFYPTFYYQLNKHAQPISQGCYPQKSKVRGAYSSLGLPFWCQLKHYLLLASTPPSPWSRWPP